MRDTSVALVEQVARLIEDNLNEPLLLDNIARSVFVSKYHLHRLFKVLTGRTLMSYVRGRRLSRSVNVLLTTEEKLSYIAEMHGFNYEQSYERAFKSQFGISPTVYRNAPKELEIVHMFDTSTIRDIANGIFVSPRFFVLPDMTLAGIRHIIPLNPKFSTAANEAALRFINIERKKLDSIINEHNYYGLTFDPDDQSYCYISCVETIGMAQLAEPFESFPLLLISTRSFGMWDFIPLSFYLIIRWMKYITISRMIGAQRPLSKEKKTTY